MTRVIDALVYSVQVAFPGHEPIDLIEQIRESVHEGSAGRFVANCFTLPFPAPSRPAAGVAVAGDWKGTITLKVTDPDSLRWFQRLAGGSDFPVPGPPHQVRRRHPALARSLSLPGSMLVEPKRFWRWPRLILDGKDVFKPVNTAGLLDLIAAAERRMMHASRCSSLFQTIEERGSTGRADSSRSWVEIVRRYSEQ